MSINKIRFSQADVFTGVPYKGNPVAVIIDGDQLTDTEMQAIANWTHLSETTFICSPTNPEADYRLRIFTPHEELPFAGHPTVGSARVALNNGIKPAHDGYLVQECGKGLVKIYINGDQLSFALPEPKISPVADELVSHVARALGLEDLSKITLTEMVDVGAIWLTMGLKSVQDVLSLDPQDEQLVKLLPTGTTGVTVFGPQTSADSDLEVRSFAPVEGVHEDPVCGSGNGAVAALIKEHHLLNKQKYIASQGQKMGRNGIINVDLDANDQILVGGHAVECITGQLLHP
ncbi:PhzF family phenazine biosynthesis protein [Limosilactobacillus sp.]|uniref:PhzF family phenazine biosynthesis protein n=1 Tax=Limosilactobacillus sp. TaxID=2773925 RepID=UPI003F046D74